MVGKHYGFTVMLSTPSILQSSWVRGRLASLFAFREKHSLGRMVTCPGTPVGTAGMDILGPCSVSKESACTAGDSGSILGQEEPLEKEMALHSSTLAGRIPLTEEAGGLQSKVSQKVRYNRVTDTFQASSKGSPVGTWASRSPWSSLLPWGLDSPG